VRTSRLPDWGVANSVSMRSRRSAGLRSPWPARMMIFLARSSLSLLASSAKLRSCRCLRVPLTSPGCPPAGTLCRLEMERWSWSSPGVPAGTTKGLFRVPKRPRPLLAGEDLSLRHLGHLTSLNSVRIRTELTIEPSRAYLTVIIDREAQCPQASVAAERRRAPA
jgi:hypothetical protein